MPLRGRTLNFALIPVLYTEQDDDESVVPAHIELSNGRMTDGAHWLKRPGYGPVGGQWSTGNEKAVTCLIPYGRTGYAIDETGAVCILGDGEVTALTGTVPYFVRPDFVTYDDTVIVASGKQLCILDPDNLVEVEDQDTQVKQIIAAPHARFVCLLNDRVILSGHDQYEWRFSDPGNLQSYPDGNFKEVERKGGTPPRVVELRGVLYAICSTGTEIWQNSGGVLVYTRSYKISKGSACPYSVVVANDNIYFYGTDGNFYTLQGNLPKIISRQIRRTLDAVVVRTDCYGIDFPAEHVIRWFFPTNGLCVAYDYANDTWSDDFTWQNAGRSRLGVGAYMETSDGIAVIGDYDPTGLLYLWSHDYTTDAGEEIRVIRRATVTANKYGFSARMNRLTMRASRGNATADETSPDFYLRWRLDEGDWSDVITFTAGEEGDKLPYVDLYSLGVGREVQVEIVETDAVKWLLTDAFLTSQQLGR